jgi:hypothetical protein
MRSSADRRTLAVPFGGMGMPVRVEVFAAGGIAVGVLARTGHVREALEGAEPLAIERVTWHALDGSKPRPIGEVSVAPDDILLASAEEADELPVHAQWHDVALDVGPYRIRGQMPTMPGFDPGRALARPTGEFVQLRDVTIGLAGDAIAGMVRPMVLANRYCVERVEADLMLGFFFPGAEMITTGGPEVAAAGVAGPVAIEAVQPA